ncbi:MAG: glutamine--fructose-6-phosphate transaminase (isomerizing) [Oscillospiraceae bacterium]
MCGIVGYVGNKNATEVLIDGLSKLEYRGYDSSGVAFFDCDNKISVIKEKGALKNMEKKLLERGKSFSNCGIGHTRWATHGEPSYINSHPHGTDKVFIVHNGIIENYSEIKVFLLNNGYKFESDTDTEIVAKLLDYYYKGDPIKAINKTLKDIKGSYAFGIIFNDYKDTIYALRKDSPLIVGVGLDDHFISSDVPAILKYTRNYYLLEENEIATITKDKAEFVDLDGNIIKKEVLVADWDVESAERGGYDHFMLKEIYEQPEAVRKTIKPRIVNSLPEFNLNNLNDDNIKSVKRIHIIACGTAMHAGVIIKNVMEKFARVDVIVDIASEFRYKNPILYKDDLVIVISQSGETADTLAALKLAKDEGCYTMAIVNVVGSSIARLADDVIYTWAGPEISVASTKAYSVQIAIGYLLGIKFGMCKGLINEDEAKDLIKKMEQVPKYIEETLKLSKQCKNIAEKLKDKENMFFIGRGLDYALAMEGSLKLKEISYIHSESYAAGELKHGTISLIVKDLPVIAIATQKNIIEKTISNIKEVKARGAQVVLLSVDGYDLADDASDYIIRIPKLDDVFLPMLAIIPLQLFSYYISVERGCNIDKPRNLAKSVTVE